MNDCSLNEDAFLAGRLFLGVELGLLTGLEIMQPPGRTCAGQFQLC